MHRRSSQRGLLVLATVLTTTAGFCLLAFQLIGARVDSQGLLREPFALLPTGVLLLCSSGVALIGAWLWPKSQR